MENNYDKETKSMNYFTESVAHRFTTNVDEMNEDILADFYNAVEWLLSRGYEEYYEIISRTINPAQQNAFFALREYRVKRNGHYKLVSIYHRFWGGCWIEERELN